MTHGVQIHYNGTGGSPRYVVSEDHPLPVSATFSGSITVGSIDGDIAHDAPDASSDPIKVGFKAESTTPAAVADNDRSNWSGTLYGAGFVNLRRASDGAEQGTSSTPFYIANSSGQAGFIGLSAVVDEVAPATIGESAAGSLRMTPTGDLRVCLTNSAGDNFGTASLPLSAFVQGSYSHDEATGGSRPPLITGSVARSSEPNAVADADACMMYVDLNGYQHVRSHGNVAHDAVDSGNPVKIGGYAVTVGAQPGTVAAGDRVQAWFDQLGRLVIVPTDDAGNLGYCGLTGTVDEVSPGTISEGAVGKVRMTPTRDIRVCLTDSAGSNQGTDGNPIKIATPGYSSGIAIVAQPQGMRSDVFTGTTTGVTVDASSSAKRFFSLQVTQTGGVTVWNVVLEGSLDNTTFTTIATHTNADLTGTTLFSVDKPLLYYRSRCVTITGGTNLTAVIIGVA